MNDHTLYETTVPTQGALALAHESIIRVKIAGVFVNITGDANNLLDTPSAVVVQREVYGTKGTPSTDAIGYSHVITCTVEGVRDGLGNIAQPWLVALIRAATSKSPDNKLEFQVFDALDPNLPAFEGSFAVTYVPGNTGFADKRVYSFTFTSDGVVDEIVSPIAGNGSPILESALPAGAAPGDQIVLRGYNLSGTTGVTVDGVAVAELIVVDTNTLVLVVPATVAGSAPIIVTNPAGASTALPYAAA